MSDRTSVTSPATAGKQSTQSNRSNPRTATVTPPKVVPLNETTGRIAAVNPLLKFVVADFYLSPMPQLNQTLGVYRQGQKVGEIRISGPERNQNIAADLIAGEAQVGDEVRPD